MKAAEILQLNPSATLSHYTLKASHLFSAYSAHLMSPAVLCEGDFSACFPLCFMSDSLCRMLMVISELRRQMKTQLKERKMRLRSSLSSIYCYYQFPSQRQIRALLSVAGRGTHRNSFTETQPHHKHHERRV